MKVRAGGRRTAEPMARIEYAEERDPYFNYCLYPYDPVAPAVGKLRSASLLYDSFRHAGMDEEIHRVVDAVRDAVGEHHTVWGVKKMGDRLGWELYFYDYRRRERERSITRVVKALEPWASCAVPYNENDFYFMFSIDIDERLPAGGGELEEIHMYIGNTASNVSSGICYSLTRAGRRLENFYFFFDPKIQKDEIVAKVACSAFIDTSVIPLERVLLPELRDCRTICIANKQGNDCAYFSGVDVDQFLFFLEMMEYPEPIAAFVRDNRRNLDHMLYDVGMDYRMEDDRLVILKSGYYGTF